MWIFKGGRSPLLGGLTCGLWCPFSNLAELFQSCGNQIMCKNLVWIGWAFQELLWWQTEKHKIKTKQNHTHTSKQYLRKILFRAVIVVITSTTTTITTIRHRHCSRERTSYVSSNSVMPFSSYWVYKLIQTDTCSQKQYSRSTVVDGH